MVNAAREGGSLNEYEQQKLANVARNKRILENLNLPDMSTMGQQRQSKKKTKVTRNTSDVPIGGHNLRSRSRRNSAENEEGHGGEDDLEDQQNFSPLVDSEDLNHGAQQKKKGRGVTRMQDIYSRGPDMPKLTIVLNEFGQPVGTDSEKLSSIVGTMVRKIIPVGCDDWRRVDPEKKYEVWTALQAFQDYSVCKSKRIFLTLHGCMKEAMKIGGGNGYDIPHIKKEMLERQERLPLQLSCDALLVHEAMTQINY